MINFLHNFSPDPLLVSLGPIDIRWYGLILVLAMAVGIIAAIRSGRKFGFGQDTIIDLSTWVIIGGLLGARIYEVFLEASYYFSNPAAIIKVWEGGLAVHGGLVGGAIALCLFARKRRLNMFALAASIVPGVAIGQTIGRWGNWFNQELFGLPTDLPWGIPISLANRPEAFKSFEFFHPTFLYESLGCLVIFLLLQIILKIEAANEKKAILLVSVYLFSYSVLRFALEYIKVDTTPELLGWRWPQLISVLIAIGAAIWITAAGIKKSL